MRHISHSVVLLFKDSTSEPLHHVDAAPNPTLIPLGLAGLRRGLARGNLMRTLTNDYNDCVFPNLGYTSK